jgi:tRNA(fMet)-specific endonuclease VapC
MEYLLDTNICIYIIKKRPIKVFEKLGNLTFGSVGISSITLVELQYGIMKSSNPEKTKRHLINFLLHLRFWILIITLQLFME